MSLLKNLTPFAVGNYPSSANPWSLQPMRVQPGNPYITPEATRPAETDNYLFGTIIDTLNGSNKSLALLSVFNWFGSAFASSSSINGVSLTGGIIQAAGSGKSSSGANSFFIGTGSATTSANSFQVLYSGAGGKDFINTSFPTAFRTNSSSCNILSLFADQSGDAMVILPFGTLNTDATFYFYNSGSWGAPNNASSLGGGAASSIGSSGYWDTVNGKYTINANNGAIGVYTVPSGGSFPTSCPASSPPSGSGNVSATILLFGNGVGFQIPHTQTSSGWAHVWRYTDPATAGTHTYPAFAIASTDVCEAADFSAIDGFMVAVWNGTNTYFMASSLASNGTAWAATSGGIAGVHIIGLVCLGAYTWMAIDSTSMVYYSIDAGTTWTKSNGQISNTLTGFTRGNLIRNPDANQAFAFSATGSNNIFAGYSSFILG
jgi:hypothetical protein